MRLEIYDQQVDTPEEVLYLDLEYDAGNHRVDLVAKDEDGFHQGYILGIDGDGVILYEGSAALLRLPAGPGGAVEVRGE